MGNVEDCEDGEDKWLDCWEKESEWVGQNDGEDGT